MVLIARWVALVLEVLDAMQCAFIVADSLVKSSEGVRYLGQIVLCIVRPSFSS